ncbi:efflux RND transporter permease subunit [Lachnospiraceae bacterium 54-53]
MGIIKAVLKRPITMVLAILCLVVFGLSSILTAKMELTPEMSFPMMIITSVYAGAGPDDVNDLVTKPVEEAVGTLSGIKNIQSVSQENISILILEYEYGTDMDKAYSDLKKKIDNVDLPDDVELPDIMEFNLNDSSAVTLAVNDSSQKNLYNFVNNKIVPEFEKISSVASVDISGGRENYVSVSLIPEKMNQYHLTMNSISQAIKAADFTYPAGSTGVGKQDLSVSTAVEIETVESLKKVPLVAGNGKTIYIEDIANISEASKKQEAIGRYNGEDTITLSINKQQKDSAVDVSKGVTKTLDNLKQEYPSVGFVVIDDTSDRIMSALNNVKNTMIMAVAISMIIIFLFFGDLKASLIVGSSIPVSMLIALIMMSAMGFSMNLITMSSIVLAIGNMVDDSIVVLDSCFRAQKGKGFREYMKAAISGTGEVFAAILGGALTNCVVFIPLALLEGMSGQLFRPLGFTLIFASLASAISGLTIVPMCYTRIRPIEKNNSPVGGIVKALQNGYTRLVSRLLDRKALVMTVSVLLLAVSFLLAGRLGFELMPEVDEGTISVSMDVKPGLKVEEIDKLLQQVEKIVTREEDLESYMTTYGGSGLSLSGGGGATVTAYLKDERKLSTKEIVNKWKKAMNQFPNTNITVASSSDTDTSDFEVILQSAQLEELKASSDRMVSELSERSDLIKVHSDLENAAPVIKVRVDPLRAAAEGVSPANVGAVLNGLLSGVEAATMDMNGEEISVEVEYPEDSYDTLNRIEGITVPNGSGGSVALTDIAGIGYEDSPSAINRKNKQYLVTVTGSFTDEIRTGKDKVLAKKSIDQEVVSKYLNSAVTRAKNSEDETMAEELTKLIVAIATAVFLLFVVMAAQFESLKLSLMVMTAIPFSLTGAFGLMVTVGIKINMPSLLGFLMLVGTVVKSGILYVETAGQYRLTMEKRSAVVQAGTSRFRSILMTTLIAIVSIIPMALGIGDDGETMQGLSLVNVGGLTASTVLTLLLLPVYYSIMTGKTDKSVEPD